MAAEFGVFSPVFKSGNYLSLLHLGGPDVKQAVTLVLECCQRSSDQYEEIANLFDHLDWRPHLVGAVALTARPYNKQACSKLWEAFDAGSWVTPQLAVAAFLCDPTFSIQAGNRIRSRCPVNRSRLVEQPALDRHISSGPAGISQRSAKAASSLVRLAGLLASRPEWLDDELASPDLTDLLATDIDHSAEIAQHWLDNLKVLSIGL
jgi:hypothetical protein